MVPLVAVLLAPDVGADRAEDAHEDLQQDDEGDLEVQEVVEGPCMAAQIVDRVPVLSDTQVGHNRPSGDHDMHQHMTQW